MLMICWQAGYGGLAIRTRDVSVVEAESVGVIMAESGSSTLKIKHEADEKSPEPVKGLEFKRFTSNDPYLTDLADEAEALSKVVADSQIKTENAEVGMTEQDARTYKPCLALAVHNSEALVPNRKKCPDIALGKNFGEDVSSSKHEATMESQKASKELKQSHDIASKGFQEQSSATKAQNTPSKIDTKSIHYNPKSFNEAINYLEKIKVRSPPSHKYSKIQLLI
jgi:hypothetical protein